jgi:predicted transposase YdaD
MNEYDTTLKLLLQGRASRSLRELTGVAVTEWLHVELPEIGDRRVDLLGRTGGGGLIHIELQSANDADMPLRMAEYCLRIYRQLRRFPRQIVLYVGRKTMRMEAELAGSQQSFRYSLIDIRKVDGEALLASDQLGDNVIAVLTRLRHRRKAVQEIVGRLSGVEEDAREFYLQALLELAGLRGLEEFVEEEARKMPILRSTILENKVLGREYKRGRQEGVQEGVQQGIQQGELVIVRRQIEARFGIVPQWAEELLAKYSAAEVEELSVRLLEAESLEQLLK